MQDNYFLNRAKKSVLKTREILETLPSFVIEFFVGIQMQTSELTRLNYAYDLRIFFDYICKKTFKNTIIMPEITLKDLEKITAFDIELFLEYLTSYTFNGKHYCCKENAKERKLSTLRSFFKYYFKKDKLAFNVTTKVDMPKIHSKNIVKLEADEVVKLLEEVENKSSETKHKEAFHKLTKIRDVALLTLFLGTGIRISECVGLNKTDIDFNINGFTITRKGGNKTILYFSKEVEVALKEYMNWLKTDFAPKVKNKDALFLSLQGTRITVRAVQLLVKKYSYQITPLKKITPHKLRSTYGTALYRETQDIYIVADVLGHKDINTTKKHYAEISDSIRRAAASAVKLRDDTDTDKE